MEPAEDTVQPSQAEDPRVAALVARGRERGFVTSGEVFAAFPDLEPETAELSAIYTRIEAQGVKIEDEIRAELELEDQQRVIGETSSSARRRPSEHRPGEAVSRPGAAAGRRLRTTTTTDSRDRCDRRASSAASTRCGCT
jgi:hypothetical protein